MTSAVGYYIYAGFVPLLKTFLTIAAGFALTKNGLWTPAGAKGSAVVNVNVALPCLVFSSIVPAFNSSNITFLGPIFMMAFLYIFVGLFLSLILGEFVFVPRRFRWGFMTCGAMSNWNNLPTAVIMTIFMHPPFSGTADIQLGIAFIAVFIVAFQLSYFVTGLWKTAAWDFKDTRPIPADEDGNEIPETMREKWEARKEFLSQKWARLRGGKAPKTEEDGDEEKTRIEQEMQHEREEQVIAEQEKAAGGPDAVALSDSAPDGLPTIQSSTYIADHTPPAQSTPPPPSGPRWAPHFVRRAGSKLSSSLVPVATGLRRFWAHPIAKPLRIAWYIMKQSSSPVTLSVIIALPISLISPLKALFVELEPGDKYYGFALGPDGNPALAFVLNTATFIGGISVPQGLLLLGSSFARMTIPRPFTKLPILAMFGMTAIKCVILPVIGVAFTQYLTWNTSLIPPDALALRFVIMFLSGTPGAVNQIVITQLFSPDGKADTLAAFLLIQYLFMFFGSAALAALVLSLL